MTGIVRREVYRRSVWGKLCRFLFFAWNIALGVHTLLVVGRLSEVLEGRKGLEGWAWTSIATHVLVRQLAVWIAGAVVLGVLAYATRGERYYVETNAEEAFSPKPHEALSAGWWMLIVTVAAVAGFLAATLIFGIPRR